MVFDQTVSEKVCDRTFSQKVFAQAFFEKACDQTFLKKFVFVKRFVGCGF
jgi:hypothetical protein